MRKPEAPAPTNTMPDLTAPRDSNATAFESFASSPDAAIARWYALRVGSRREAVVCRQLLASGVWRFCPHFVETVRWSDRLKQTARPWFPGYVFARFDLVSRIAILNVRGVIEVLSLDQRPVPIPDDVIADLQTVCRAPVTVGLQPYVLGSAIRVRVGPWAGVTGAVERTKGAALLWIPVEILGRSVSVPIAVEDVEKA